MEQMLSFKGWMAMNNVKQTELAELLDLSLQSVNQKVNGRKSFTLEQVAIICSAYGISADIFLPAELQKRNGVAS